MTIVSATMLLLVVIHNLERLSDQNVEIRIDETFIIAVILI